VLYGLGNRRDERERERSGEVSAKVKRATGGKISLDWEVESLSLPL
jgi:hypothetical protein